jgi:single-strand DNA-binding protein
MIIGNLGRDPEMRYTPSGKPVTTFSVATSRAWNTSEGEKRMETEWFNVVAWSSLANNILPKGNRYISKVDYRQDIGMTRKEINIPR